VFRNESIVIINHYIPHRQKKTIDQLLPRFDRKPTATNTDNSVFVGYAVCVGKVRVSERNGRATDVLHGHVFVSIRRYLVGDSSRFGLRHQVVRHYSSTNGSICIKCFGIYQLSLSIITYKLRTGNCHYRSLCLYLYVMIVREQ